MSIDLMDQVIDLIKPGKPDALICSKRSRRRLSALRRTSGNLLETDVDAFGRMALYYDGIPLLVDEFVSDTQVKGSSAANCSSIYAVRWGMNGVMGLENGGITVERLGSLQSKDAERTRVKWYCGMAVCSELGVARLEGILP